MGFWGFGAAAVAGAIAAATTAAINKDVEDGMNNSIDSDIY